jgi:hypothetical protein
MSDPSNPGNLPAMVVQTANALITHAPISEEQLRAALPHYRALADLLRISGPSFSQSLHLAVQFHNKALERLRESESARVARERRHREEMDGFTELTVS